MKLHKLQVTNFRNLNNDVFEFSDNINCIFGNNGNGKTNILEAIHFLVNRKSVRKNTSFPQIISIESETPEILFSSILIEEKNKGKAILFSTHVLHEVEYISDRIILIDRGKIVQNTNTESLRGDHQNLTEAFYHVLKGARD